MTKRQLLDTFRVDNWVIQNAPLTFGARRAGIQLHLPGLEPFGPFDYWATLALYSLLDPKNPTAPVETTATELLTVLSFAREVSDALAGYETFPSEAYNLLEESLQRLFTVEVTWRNYWEVRTGKGSKKPGRPKKQWVEYHGRILVEYSFVYSPGVEPPALLPASARVNVNKAKTTTGELGPAIWKRKEGPRPVGISYQLAPRLVNGLTGEDPNIGATIVPLRIFRLRSTFGAYPIATRLLLWVIRQTGRDTTRHLDRLALELNVKGKDKRRNRETLKRFFAMLQTAGVVETFSTFLKDGEEWVTFRKADFWHIERDKTAQALPAPRPV